MGIFSLLFTSRLSSSERLELTKGGFAIHITHLFTLDTQSILHFR